MRSRLAVLALIGAAMASGVQAQFSSGSTGTDGALNLTTAGTVVLDPTTFSNQCTGNVCNFTRINIASGVTASLRHRSSLAGDGRRDHSRHSEPAGLQWRDHGCGEPGASPVARSARPWGFPGGVGQYLTSPAQPGGGFGGGAARTPAT